jgi:GNAT superfamily N-acetyltransferase
MGITIRPAVASDAEACGRIMFEAFKGIADSHAFPWDFPSVAVATELAHAFIGSPTVFGVVAERDGRVAGSNFLGEGDPIRAVGPITVDPAAQGDGIGRRLMEAVIERGRGATGIRLVQDAFNTRSMSLYASLGFDVMEPLLLVAGKPKSGPVPGFEVRPLVASDMSACEALCRRVHGITRNGEVGDARRLFRPFVVRRGGHLTGYLTAPTFWIMNHGVAETDEDMTALILGAAALSQEPVSLLVPTRSTSFLRWCLSEGLRAVKPMTLMAMGQYQQPQGAVFPSVFY